MFNMKILCNFVYDESYLIQLNRVPLLHRQIPKFIFSFLDAKAIDVFSLINFL